VHKRATHTCFGARQENFIQTNDIMVLKLEKLKHKKDVKKKWEFKKGEPVVKNLQWFKEECARRFTCCSPSPSI